jgi:hypothetical protein
LNVLIRGKVRGIKINSRNPLINQHLFTEMESIYQKSFLEEDDQVLENPQIIILGVFGHNNKVSETDLQENTLNLILQELGRLPDKVLIPSEGNTSIYIQEWAESLKIECQIFQADFRKHNKLAWILRDDRIQKECTHGLYFLSQKSDKLEKQAEKMAKKGKRIFTSSPYTQELIELVSEKPLKVSEPVHKLNKGKGLELWLNQTLKC